ncbi:MAG: hypothetical protein PF636_06100 [Actinomycetota bacterium]|jgi:hypothetical protein|nr:hypothetical protein [Actinomycetota bacterium]
MILVLAKVLISPLLLATATFVIHRWGGLVGGLLLGLPLVSGPVSAMLFAQYGSQFAVHAAYGTLLGFVAAGMFCTSYAVVAPRHAWWQSLVAAYATFFTVAGLLSLLHVALGWALVSVPVILVSLAFAIRVPESAHDEPVPRKRILALRMALAGAMVVLITTCAGRLGPEIAGFLAPLPVIAAIMAASSHRRSGSDSAHRLLRGAVLGSWGGAAFFSVVILLSGSAGPITTYSVATIAAVCVGLFAVGLQTAARSLRVTGLRLPALLVKA